MAGTGPTPDDEIGVQDDVLERLQHFVLAADFAFWLPRGELYVAAHTSGQTNHPPGQRDGTALDGRLLVDLPRAAAMLGVSPWVLRRYVDDGLIRKVRLPSAKNPGEMSRRVLFAPEDLEAFVARHRQGGAP